MNYIIDKTLAQRVGYLVLSVILVLAVFLCGHKCPVVETAEATESSVEPQVIYMVVYVVDGKVVDTNEETEAPVEETKYYDVPLSEELQDHIFELCEVRGIDPRLIISMIKRESTYTADAIGDGGDSLGLMQIQPQWHSHRMEEYGCDNLLDPFQNVTIGIDIIADYIEKGKGVEWALMAYNGGGSYANDKLAAGEVSDYARSVVTFAEGL